MNASQALTKTRQFRNLLLSEQLQFICEAHNGLSAKIVQEAGFPGIWASGLSISAQFGVRDNNEASWTQVLEDLEFMSDATRIPILLDGDTGYGNFNNMQRLIRKLEQRNIAAVCIEDKLFPKTNSFLKGDAQPLAEPFHRGAAEGVDLARVALRLAPALVERLAGFRRSGHARSLRPDRAKGPLRL